MGHILIPPFQKMILSGLVDNIIVDFTIPLYFCDICVKAKIDCKPFPDETDVRVDQYDGYIHSDLWGWLLCLSFKGTAHYMVTFTDAFFIGNIYSPP